MPELETTDLETDLSLFKYDDLEQLPPRYRDLAESERTERIERALDALDDDVLVLGHNYQREEIVEHADFIGDSYALSKRAAEADADHVVFCGVTFMAESADIITDDSQAVILPSMEASCPMAGMAEALQVDAAWAEITDVAPDENIIPVTYMNSYADLKAFCAEQGGLVCTSSNAHKAFEYAFEKGDKVLFLPDKHLGENTAHRLGMEDETAVWDPWDPEGKDANEVAAADIVLWEGYCQVHERFRVEHVEVANREKGTLPDGEDHVDLVLGRVESGRWIVDLRIQESVLLVEASQTHDILLQSNRIERKGPGLHSGQKRKGVP